MPHDSMYKRAVKWKLLEHLPDEQYREVRGKATKPARFRRNSPIVFQGGEGQWMYFIEEGHVAVKVGRGREAPKMIRVLGPGDHFGELALLRSAAVERPLRNAYVYALDDVVLYQLWGADLDELRSKWPAVTAAILNALLEEIDRLSLELDFAKYEIARRRLAHQLLYLEEAYGSGVAIQLSAQDIGELCGLSLMSVEDEILELKARGLIERSDTKIAILDHDALKQLDRRR